MKNLDEFISSLKVLADEAPMTAVVLPPKTVGFPVGTYNLKILLVMIAENLEGNVPNCRKGSTKNGTGIH